MKEVNRYKCDFCRTLRATIAGIEKHEKQCTHSPDSINCYRCAYAYEGEYDDDYGFRTREAPICAYNEDIIRENIADRCGNYKRSDKTYGYRNECPEIEDREDIEQVGGEDE